MPLPLRRIPMARMLAWGGSTYPSGQRVSAIPASCAALAEEEEHRTSRVIAS